MQYCKPAAALVRCLVCLWFCVLLFSFYRQRNSKPADRRYFVGGSDARIIIGDDEAALPRLWREKRGEVEPEDLSDNPTLVELDRYKRLSAVFDWRQFPEPYSWPSPILVDALDACLIGMPV